MNTGVCVQNWDGNGSYISATWEGGGKLLYGRVLIGITYIWGFVYSWKVSMPTVGIPL